MQHTPAHRRSKHTRATTGFRYCLSGGGTGGHVYPALAVAEALQKSAVTEQQRAYPFVETHYHVQSSNGYTVDVNSRIVYIGSVGGMEERIVARESTCPYRAVPAAAMRGRSVRAMLHNGATLMAGVVAAHAVLRHMKPSVILGTGGYVCVPVFVAARLLGIPTLLFLPDVVPGVAVRLLSRIATRTACSVALSAQFLRPPHPLIVTGYPVRSTLYTLSPTACRAAFQLHNDVPVLLVYGGSRGARTINQAINTLLPQLLTMAQIIHVCGREGDDEWLNTTATQLPPHLRARYHLFPYLDNTGTHTMTCALGAADMVICRSGASILGELPAVGLPAILVPYPYVHQDENADYLVAHGAAIKLSDSALAEQEQTHHHVLLHHLRRLLHTHPHERLRMAEQCRAVAQPHAAVHLANTLYTLAARGSMS